MRTATNPQTGEKLVFYGDKWVPMESSATNPQTGQKAYKIGGRWITDEPDKSVPDSAPSQPQQEEKQSSIGDKLKGAGEAALSIGSGITGGTIGYIGGALGGLAGNIASGKYGTQEGAQMASETAAEGAHRFTYQPRTQEGKDALDAISKVFTESKVEGIGPMALPEAESLAQATRPSRAALGHAARVVGKADTDFQEMLTRGEQAQMAGGGAATTAGPALRRARAESLPVPIKLTKGQTERTFEQQQFERETAKNPTLGEPLRERYAEQNQKILQNFDAWIDQTGAEAGSLRATGETVTTALVAKSEKAKAQIRAAYKEARESGAMQEKLPIFPLQKYVEGHQAEAINAPLIKSVEVKLGGIASKDGTISINDLEEIRKMVNDIAEPGTPNGKFGGEIKSVIDSMTEGHGGEAYKRARALRYRYAQEFEDHAVVDKLLSVKPGTKDRVVAYEDVFSHSILKGSLDDVRTMRKTLQTAGPKGEQAWRELQGATLRHIRDEITNNVQIDQTGRQMVSPAKLNRLVTELDKDGKLDFIFGKQGAQQIRDINGIALDAFTSPPGSVNHPNTAAHLIHWIDKIAYKTTGIPYLGAATGYLAKERQNAKVRKQVQESLK